MRFQPKTEEELQAESVLPAGTYDFECIEAADTVSKNNNDMITAKIKVFGPDGGFRLVTDYLMEKMAYKLRHFCESTGLMAAYESGDLMARHCEGRTGKVVLQVDPERKSEDGMKTFRPKNSVKDYIGTSAQRGKQAVPAMGGASDLEDDDIPF
jgi:hypothetical protein